jgi:hypothetical protein
MMADQRKLLRRQCVEAERRQEAISVWPATLLALLDALDTAEHDLKDFIARAKEKGLKL